MRWQLSKPLWMQRWLIRRKSDTGNFDKRLNHQSSLFSEWSNRLCTAMLGDEIQACLSTIARTQSQIYFIQIGAADGAYGDPLADYVKKWNWSGILVEPVPYLFQRLKQNYADSRNLVFENVAISDKDELREFWYPRQAEDTSKLPLWYEQLGSFSREVILRHSARIPGLEEMLMMQNIPCITLATLLEKHQVTKIDVLQIDTEGYDYGVIQQLDFAKFRPKLIIYEHKHLSPRDRPSCIALLRSQDYQIIEQPEGNAIAVRSL